LIYSVEHTTTFRYQPEVRESVMEVRMEPRSEGNQRCLDFRLDIIPAANIMQYRDFSGNAVHHFDIAGAHRQVKITARSSVEIQALDEPHASAAGEWSDLDALVAAGDYWEMLLPSQFAQPSAQLQAFTKEVGGRRRGRPFELLVEFNEAIYRLFAYVPNSTKVDSPIADALEARQGVCQDFAHIMIALVRPLRIPCRYVSGYMFHRGGTAEKQDRSLEGASHAWVEALVPGLGWTAFDPTNNLVGGDRHIRVALGRDYADVPPTRGVYKGEAESELSVAVTVSPSDAAIPQPATATAIVMQPRPGLVRRRSRADYEQQQQQ
jgi:transglutaminase-like putative cysteine protease